jgi:type IV secretory pathway VirB2 component (pilin)
MKLTRKYQNENMTAGRNHTACTVLLLLFVLGLMPQIAAAAPWNSAAVQVLSIFQGGLMRTLGIIAVIGCGIAALAGKLSWNWAINIIIGLVLMFGAAAIVDYLIAGSSY